MSCQVGIQYLTSALYFFFQKGQQFFEVDFVEEYFSEQACTYSHRFDSA